MNATVTLTGIQVTASNLPLPDVSTWFAWYYSRNLDFSAAANVVCSDIVATSDIESVDATGTGQYSVNGTQIDAEFGSISMSGVGFTSVEGDEIGAQNAEIQAVGGALLALSGLQSALESGELTGTGEAFTTQEGQTLTTDFGEITLIGAGNAEIDGLSLDSAQESVDSTGDADYLTDGLLLASAIGEVVAFSEGDGFVSVSGIELSVFQGQVSANALSADILYASGTPKRYSASAFRSASVKITGIATKISTGAVKALGVVSISATANVENVRLDAQVETISSKGVLWISDEELLALLAA